MNRYNEIMSQVLKTDDISLNDAIKAYLDNPLSYNIGIGLRIKLKESFKVVPRLEMSKALINQSMYRFLKRNKLV